MQKAEQRITSTVKKSTLGFFLLKKREHLWMSNIFWRNYIMNRAKYNVQRFREMCFAVGKRIRQMWPYMSWNQCTPYSWCTEMSYKRDTSELSDTILGCSLCSVYCLVLDFIQHFQWDSLSNKWTTKMYFSWNIIVYITAHRL